MSPMFWSLLYLISIMTTFMMIMIMYFNLYNSILPDQNNKIFKKKNEIENDN